MIKILIIDDDILIRKGIKSLMPWEKYQMKVVGEAANGQEALEFLKTNKVDLALVDLDMPVMGGIPFIQEAAKIYPDLNYVVLTVHTEFEYIQEILRLGALDYIAKTQFDKENFDQILQRIKDGIIKKRSYKQSSLGWSGKILYPAIYSLIGFQIEDEEQVYQFWKMNGLQDDPDRHEIYPNVWIFTSENSNFLFPEKFSNMMLLCVRDVKDMEYKHIGKLLRNYRNGQFFYDYRPVKKVNFKYAYELEENEYIVDEKTLEALKKEWVSLNWINENKLFEKFRLDLKNSKLKYSNLYHVLLALESVWNASYSELCGEQITMPEKFSNWEEVEEWLIQLFEKVNLFNENAKYSQSVLQSILQVKNYVDRNYATQIDASEVVKNVHMSYGYFSRCFHDIVGVSFSDYCIQVRIQHAKNDLSHTRKTIQQISFELGYHDEKYFSRLFKKNTGMTPSEYRKAKNEISETGFKNQ